MQRSNEEKTDLYQLLYKRDLAEEEYAELHHNLVGFFELLIQIDQEQKSKRKE